MKSKLFSGEKEHGVVGARFKLRELTRRPGPNHKNFGKRKNVYEVQKWEFGQVFEIDTICLRNRKPLIGSQSGNEVRNTETPTSLNFKAVFLLLSRLSHD